MSSCGHVTCNFTGLSRQGQHKEAVMLGSQGSYPNPALNRPVQQKWQRTELRLGEGAVWLPCTECAQWECPVSIRARTIVKGFSSLWMKEAGLPETQTSHLCTRETALGWVMLSAVEHRKKFKIVLSFITFLCLSPKLTTQFYVI